MRGRKWTARGMTGVLALLCAAGGVVGQTPDAGDKPVAIVNGEPIPKSTLDAVLKQDGPMPVAVTESQRKQKMQLALNALINDALMRQFLRKNAPPADPKQVEARLNDLMVGLKQQNKTLDDLCRESKQTPAQIKATIAAILQWQAFAHDRVSDQDVEKFYKENKDFFDKAQVHAAEIMLRVTPQGGKEDRERVKTQLAALREKIVKNEIEFAQAAKEYSQGPTKEQGGDLDWFPHLKGILPDSVMQAAFTLPPNQVSEVLNSEYGVHLIKVIDRKAGEPSDFSKIKEEVRQFRMEEMQQEILRDLRQSAEKAGQIQVFLQ
jgi:parvulin-like peptidyl-prolyl isomerase